MFQGLGSRHVETDEMTALAIGAAFLGLGSIAFALTGRNLQREHVAYLGFAIAALGVLALIAMG